MAEVRLNEAQRQAVTHDHGPLLVLAGAGSGKTGVVTRRIARLVGRGIPPRAILAMTFTNKAAGEMQERVARLAGARAVKGLLVCTFHRFGLEVLSREAKALGLRGGRFAILDRGDCTAILRDCIRGAVTGQNYDIGAIVHRISLAKNAFIDPEAYQAHALRSDDPYDEITAYAYPRYAEALAGLQAFDFDDLVCEPVRLWRRRPEVLQRWRDRFRFVIVDEYQDTNVVQLELLRLLVDQHKNLAVVGDDDQAIYAWRGADVRNILDFERHFKGCAVVRLEHNYRSRKAILDVANAILDASTADRHAKRLIATQGDGDPVRSVLAPDGTAEARFVAEETHRLLKGGHAQPRDVAVLYRSNLQAGEVEAELRARGIPYQLVGGTQTFEKKEVKDVMAYLQAALDPDHELAVRRSINYPPRGIGPAALTKLAAFASDHHLSLFGAVRKAHAIAGLATSAREGCREYARAVEATRRDIEGGSLGAGEVIKALTTRLDLKRQILSECGTNNKAAARRSANLGYLVRTFERRDERKTLDAEGWRTFLRLLLLREERDDDDDAPDNRVTLTTMHGAKGLEFRFVFVVGLEEGLMPHRRTLEEHATDAAPLDGRVTDEIEQERRLFYVAVTRAKEVLYLCRAAARPSRGKMVKRAPSRFLVQIPETLLQAVDVAAAPAPDTSTLKKGADDVLAALLGGNS
ncbi:MAG: UvrD-helicase domain-containing protein [Myxococcota bacterium]